MEGGVRRHRTWGFCEHASEKWHTLVPVCKKFLSKRRSPMPVDYSTLSTLSWEQIRGGWCGQLLL